MLKIPVAAATNEILISTEAELVQAIRNAQPGDEIVVMPGVYCGKLGTGSTGSGFGSAWFNSDQDGTKENPIILRSYDKNDKAVLTGSEQKVTGLRITGDYWIIDGIEICNTQKGIILDNSNYSVIQDCSIHDTLQEGLHLRDGSSYNLVTETSIYKTGTGSPGYGEGVYIGSDKNKWSTYAKECDYNVIRGCTIGPDVAAEHFDIKEGTTGTIIEQNIMHGAGMTGENYADSFIDAKGNETIIRENKCYREGNEIIVAAFQTHQQVEEWGLNNSFIYNELELDDETIVAIQAAQKAPANSYGNVCIPEGCVDNSYVTILEESKAQELLNYQIDSMAGATEGTTEDAGNTTEGTTEDAGNTTEDATEDTGNTTEEVKENTYNYGTALQKSLIFYELQKSGKLDGSEYNRNNWRGDSCLQDGQDAGIDLTGGWFDAGDTMKFNLPMSYTAATLAWSYLENQEAYEKADQTKYILNSIQWANDYFIKCHPEDNVYYYQVGKVESDHDYWGAAETVETRMDRPCYKVDATAANGGSTVCAETAASLAACSIVFKDQNPEYAQTCLSHSKQLLAMAENAKSDNGYTAAEDCYDSWSGFYDEFSWANIWLYRATGENQYLQKAQEYTQYWGTEGNSEEWAYTEGQCWDDVHYGAALMMAQIDSESEVGQKCKQTVENNLDWWKNGANQMSPMGMAWMTEWSSLAYSTTAAFMAMLYVQWDGADPDRVTAYEKFAKSQADYALGSSGQCFQVGYQDEESPRNVHHATAHGTWTGDLEEPERSRHLLVGALVGGPRKPDDQYVDDRSDYYANEVACDYNAGFTGLLASLYDKYGQKEQIDPNAGAYEEVDDIEELSIEAGISQQDKNGNWLSVKAAVYNKTAWPARVTNQLKYYYFVDISDVLENGGSVADISVYTDYSTSGAKASELKPWDADNGIYYTEIDLTGTSIYPGGEGAYNNEMYFRIASNRSWDYTKSPSYQGLEMATADSMVRADNMVLYDNDKVVFGTEPQRDSDSTTENTIVATTEEAVVTTGAAAVTTEENTQENAGNTTGGNLNPTTEIVNATTAGVPNATTVEVTNATTEVSVATTEEAVVTTGAAAVTTEGNTQESAGNTTGDNLNPTTEIANATTAGVPNTTTVEVPNATTEVSVATTEEAAVTTGAAAVTTEGKTQENAGNTTGGNLNPTTEIVNATTAGVPNATTVEVSNVTTEISVVTTEEAVVTTQGNAGENAGNTPGGNLNPTTETANVTTAGVPNATTAQVSNTTTEVPVVTPEKNPGNTTVNSTNATTENSNTTTQTPNSTTQDNSSAINVIPAKVKSVKKQLLKGKLKLTWKKQSGITGYKIYKYNKKSKKYKLIKTVKKNTATIKKIKKNQLYKFKVKAYKKVGAITNYGAASKVIKVKRKK